MTARWRLLPNDPEVGSVPFLFLAYLPFVFLSPLAFVGTLEAEVYVASAVATIVFVPLYFAAYWVHGWSRLGVAAAMATVSLALAPINPGSNTFFIYSTYFAGTAASTLLGGAVRVLGMVALLGVAAVFVQPSPYFWAPASFAGLLVGLMGATQVQRAIVNARLRLAQEEVEALARIAERERIGRDLHDLLGQSLSVVALKAELAESLVERDPQRAAREMGAVRQVARDALSEVRTAVRGYRVGRGAGLEHELERAAGALATAGVSFEALGDPQVMSRRLDSSHEGVLALVLREAITNVIRHAGARHCRVRLCDEPDEFGIEVRDDGRGPGRSAGHGLSGMRQRVESLGGRLGIEAAKPGTRILARFTAAEASVDAPKTSGGS